MKTAHVLAAALLAACGSARIRREVPVSLATVVEPEPAIVPALDTATVVIMGDGFPDPVQAITVITHTGQFLAQVRPHSYAVATVPAGPIGFYGGRPELGFPKWCGGLHGEVAAGKVYVLRVGGFLGTVGVSTVDSEQTPEESIASTLSYYVRYDGPNAAGQQSTGRAMDDYWKPCFEAAEDKTDGAKSSEYGQIDASSRGLTIQNAYGYASLTIPQPL